MITAPNQQIHLETTPIEEHDAPIHKLQDPVFIRVISKLNERAAQVRFEITFPTRQTEASVYMRKKVIPLPQSTALDPSPMH